MTAPASHRHLNTGAQAGADKAARHLDALTRAYGRALRAAGRRAAARFRQTEPVTAAADPKQPAWTIPPTGSLIDTDELAADTQRKTGKLHRTMLTDAAGSTLEPFGITFDVHAPTSQALLDAVGQRIQTGITAAIEEQITAAIKAGYENGDSVYHVSQAIQAATDAISRPRADMLARTDLNALANGGSLIAASISGAAATKTWLATNDDRTRETHAEADGQTVAIDDTFDVGGESAMYPGDPQLSDEEACNCRCSLVYGEPLTAAASAFAPSSEGRKQEAQPSDFASWRDHAWEGDPHSDFGHRNMPVPVTADGGPDVSGLAMVAVYPALSEARELALEDGQDPEGMHVTLVFLGEADSFDHDAAREAVADVAAAHPKLEGTVGGVGMFAPGDEGAPLIALPDVDGLTALREAIVEALAARGIVSPSEHGFLPHLTLAYVDPAAIIGVPLERAGARLTFGALSLTIAGTRSDYRLGEVAISPPPAVISGGTMSDILHDTLTAAASGDTGLPLSERDRAWDAGAAKQRVAKWASSDGSGDKDKVDWTKYGRAFFAGSGEDFGGYHLPFCDIIGGKLTAVWKGIVAAGQRLNQTEGVDKAAIAKKIDAWYRKAAKQYGDESIVPPSEKTSAAADGETLAAIRAQLADQGADGILADDELRAIILAVNVAHTLAPARHSYAGDGTGPCDLCGGPPDGGMHYAAVTASLTEFELTAAADGGTQWQATLCVAGVPTVDSGVKRVLAEDGGSWLPLPLPLGLMDETPHADMVTKSPVCGRIDQIWMAGTVIQASGIFSDGSDDPTVQAAGAKAAALVGERLITGISVDLVDADVEMMVWNGSGAIDMSKASDPTAPNEPDTQANLPNDIPDATEIPDDEIEEEDEAEELEYVMVFKRWTIAGATICPVQALTQATISLVASAMAGTGEWRGEAEWELPGLTAAAAGMVPLEPPREWFDDPQLEGPTPLTVTDDGRVFGHLATWDTCHTGLPGCVPPPRSPTGYMNFHLGEVRCADGERVAVGTLSFDMPHAGRRLDASRTQAHYDDTRTAGAHVRAGEDAYGIWLAGALNPRLSAEEARTLMAAPPSGDWRQVRQGEGRDLVGTLAVNVPGFPVPRERGGLVLAASADCAPCEEEFTRQLAVLSASADGIEALAALVEA